jgi:bacterioferritin
MPGGSFTADITAIRERARQKMEQGPATGSYGKEPKEVIAVLNEVLATEIVCWMRYTRHAISATGINRAQVASEFTEHAESERGHAMLAAGRISQLGGEPDFDRPRSPGGRTPPTRRIRTGTWRACSATTSPPSAS